MSFFQSEHSISPWFRAKRRGEPSQLDVEHLMASAAIPLVFPSIKIKQDHFGDGSIHQLSPLSAPIHMGAKKLFIIGVEQPVEPIHPMENNPHPPSVSAIAGHMLDSIFSDTLKADLERLETINNTLGLIPAKNRKNHAGLEYIETLVINPSHDFNAIALEYYQDLPSAIKILLRVMGISNNAESSIISYLLFEKAYCKQLIKLGFHDALEQESKIREFLNI